MNAIITTPNNVSLASAREGFIAANDTVYGAGKVYAQTLIHDFGVAWISGDTANGVKEEKEVLYKGLRERGHTNPSVKWSQVKKHGENILAQAEHDAAVGEKIEQGMTREEAEKAVAAEEEAAKTNGANERKSVQRRMVEDLSGLYSFCKRNKDDLNDKQEKAWALVSGALAELGVDISLLK